MEHMEPFFFSFSDFDGQFTTAHFTIYFSTGGRQRCVGGWQSRLWAYQLGRLQYGAVLLQIALDGLVHIPRFQPRQCGTECQLLFFTGKCSGTSLNELVQVEHWLDCAHLQTGLGIFLLHC